MTLSNRQYPMLKMFYDLNGFMSYENAKHWDQRPFRSMLIREWIAYHPGKGFKITKKGTEEYIRFLNTDIARKNPSMPLTAYFDATTYGLKDKKVVKIA